MNTTRRNPAITGVIAGGAVAILLALLLAGCEEAAAPTTTTGGVEVTSGVLAPPATEASSDPSAQHPDLAALDCGPLLTLEEVEEALGPAADSDLPFEMAQGEACIERLVDDPAFFVTIQPGHPDHFLAGATQIGVTGEPVAGVGDGAVWFGGDESEAGGDVGILSVAQETPLGFLLYQITLGRPDLDSAAQLEIAKTLALRALPRFPGLEGTVPAEPLVDLCALVTDEEAEGVLAGYRDFHPATQDEVVVIPNFVGLVDLRQAGDLTCTKLILAEVYVEIQQGSAEDFEAGANVAGVVGEPASGIGEEAIWFGGVPFSGPVTQGVLSIRQGQAFFRIILALPNTGSDIMQDIATELALSAVQRIPGFEGSISEGEEFAGFLEEPEVDPSDVSFVDNLLVKEEAGEWSLGEGLVATLQLFAGEADAASVLRHSEVAVTEGTGIFAMAREYLDGGPDPEARAEIARLLDLLVFTNEELEAMAGIDSQTSVSASLSGGLSGLLRQRAFFNAASFAHLAALQQVENCRKFYQHRPDYPAPPGVGPCLEWREADLPGKLKGKYRIFYPAFLQDGWTEAHYQLVLDALKRSADWFEGKGKMPPVNVVFSLSTPSEKHQGAAFPGAGRACGVFLFTPLQKEMDDQPDHAAQAIAHELAHCFQEENFPEQNRVPYGVRDWREEGVAEYLSHKVYLDVDDEWRKVPENDKLNLTYTVMNLAYANFLFFAHLDTEIGLEGIFRLIRSLPTDPNSGRSEQEKALAAFPNMKSMFHRFGEGMIDGTIIDHGAKRVDYRMEYRTVDITGTGSFPAEIRAFGLGRNRLKVRKCEIAHFNNDWGEAKDSVRPAADKTWTEFPTRIPTAPADADDRIFMVTTTEDITATIEITDLKRDRDDPECEEDPFAGIPCPLDELLECDPTGYYWIPELVDLGDLTHLAE